MRYHSKKPDIYRNHYGKVYECDHPLYDRCTLFISGEKGLAVIQQHFDREKKATYWAECDDWIPDVLYLDEGFKDFFDENAGSPKNGVYPTVPLRKIMWYLKMKPLPKTYWETSFDRSIL